MCAAETQNRPSLAQEAKTSLKRRGPRVWGCGGKDAVFCRLFTETSIAVETDIPASQGFSISLSFSTQLQHHQTTTNIDAVYIIVSASASSIQ
jgi:hypothetical protein